MTTRTRKNILRANALFLTAASLGGLRTDVLGSFYASGPESGILAAAPYTAIGFIEAHGLAFIISILFWRADPHRSWHFTAAAVHAMLGGANLAFWQIFIATDMLWLGYLTTALHWLLVVVQLFAATTAKTATAKVADAYS